MRSNLNLTNVVRGASRLATLAATSLVLLSPTLVWAQKTGTSTYTMLVPNGAANALTPWTWTLPVPDAAKPGKSKVVSVDVQPIAMFNPARETAVEASARKAKAVKDAIEADVAAGKLPNTVNVTTKQTQLPQPTGRVVWNPLARRWEPEIKMAPGPTQVSIDGVTAAVGAKNDPTRQAGNGVNFRPGNGNPVQPSPGYRPSMGGSGSSSGYSTGLDPSGNPSVLGFGFYSTDDIDPELFIASIMPEPGMTNADALSELADAFNDHFESRGFLAHYDAASDRLMFDGMRPWSDTFWFANSDAGLDLGFDLVPVPEPSALVLAALGALGACFAYRRSRS